MRLIGVSSVRVRGVFICLREGSRRHTVATASPRAGRGGGSAVGRPCYNNGCLLFVEASKECRDVIALGKRG